MTQTVGHTIPAKTTDPATSHSATNVGAIRKGTQRYLLLGAWAFYGEEGLTDEEAMILADGVSPMSEYAKRSSELRDAGLIIPTGETRPGASGTERMVSRITELGQATLRAIL